MIYSFLEITVYPMANRQNLPEWKRINTPVPNGFVEYNNAIINNWHYCVANTNLRFFREIIVVTFRTAQSVVSFSKYNGISL